MFIFFFISLDSYHTKQMAWGNQKQEGYTELLFQVSKEGNSCLFLRFHLQSQTTHICNSLSHTTEQAPSTFEAKNKECTVNVFFCQQKYKQALKTRQTHKRIVMQCIINTLASKTVFIDKHSEINKCLQIRTPSNVESIMNIKVFDFRRGASFDSQDGTRTSYKEEMVLSSHCSKILFS